jgi:hypothetical protein
MTVQYWISTKGFSPGRWVSVEILGRIVERILDAGNGELDGSKVVGMEVVGATLGEVDGNLEGLCDGCCAEGVKVGQEEGNEYVGSAVGMTLGPLLGEVEGCVLGDRDGW